MTELGFRHILSVVKHWLPESFNLESIFKVILFLKEEIELLFCLSLDLDYICQQNCFLMEESNLSCFKQNSLQGASLLADCVVPVYFSF